MAKQRHDWKEKSRLNWGTQIEEGQTLPNEYLQLGCLMRIADATELIALNYQRIINERDQYKRWYEEKRQQNQQMEKKERTLRGVITRHRNERDRLRKQLKTHNSSLS